MSSVSNGVVTPAIDKEQLMFTLHIALDTDDSQCLQGLSALDRRRELGLPDNTRITPVRSVLDGTGRDAVVTVDIPENVARRTPQCFCDEDTVWADVGLVDCVCGDIVERVSGTKSHGYVHIDINMAPARAIALFLRYAQRIADKE